MTVGTQGWQQLALGLFRRVRGELAAGLDGVGDEALTWVPTPWANSTGWLAWHLARGQDRNVSELDGHRQQWVTGGWAARFGRAADPSDTGFGHTPAQVADFRSPGAATLLAYHAAVHGRTEDYLLAAPDDDLARVVASPTLANVHTVRERLEGQIADSFAHLGQMATLRALMPRDRA